MAEKNENNKDSQKEQVTPKKYLKKIIVKHDTMLLDRRQTLVVFYSSVNKKLS